jgi:hypothetical protein
VPDDEDKPVSPPRQPTTWEVSTKLEIKSNLDANARRRRLVWQLEPDKPAGRPSSYNLIRTEAQRRLTSGMVPLTLKEFGNELSIWLQESHPDVPTMSGERVERCVRDLWRASDR